MGEFIDANLSTIHNNGFVTNSLKIKDMYGKEHPDIVKKIRHFIKVFPDLNNSAFTIDTYIAGNGQRQPMYNMTKHGFELLVSSFKTGKSLKITKDLIDKFQDLNYNFTYIERDECAFGRLLKDTFSNATIIEQLPVLNYRVDFYIEEGKVIVEYDEAHHQYQQDEDEKRINEIRKEIMRKISIGNPLYEGQEACESPWLNDKDILTVVRVKKGEEGIAINQILNAIYKNDMIEFAI